MIDLALADFITLSEHFNACVDVLRRKFEEAGQGQQALLLQEHQEEIESLWQEVLSLLAEIGVAGPPATQRKRRPNTRVKAVQAKRKQLGLGIDGKIGPWSRKESYSIALYSLGWSNRYPRVFTSKCKQHRLARRGRTNNE